MSKKKSKEEYLISRKCPKCGKGLAIMYAGKELGTGISCACGFEKYIK